MHLCRIRCARRSLSTPHEPAPIAEHAKIGLVTAVGRRDRILKVIAREGAPTVEREGHPGSWRDDRWAVGAHYLSLVVGGVVLTWLGRGQWFFADDWEFIVNRGIRGAPALGILVPHTQHWSTGPILIWRGLLSVFGLHTYMPFLLVNVAVHLAVVHLIWRLAGRAGAGTWVRTSLAALFMVAASNGYNAFWAFQISFNGTVAIGLAILLLAERREPMSRLRVALIIVMTIAMLTFSSIAIPLVVAIGALLVIRHGWRTAALCVSPAALTFAVWYLAIGRKPIAGNASLGLHMQLSASVIRPSAGFFVEGLGAAIGAPVFLGTVVALLALLGLIGWSVARRRELIGRAAGPACAALGGGLFFAIAALARSTSAADDPTQARYLYVGGALLLPLLMVCLDALVTPIIRRWNLVGPVLLVVIAALGVINLAKLHNIANLQARIEQTLRGRVLGAASQVRNGTPFIGQQTPEPLVTIDLRMNDLVRLIGQGWVPTEPDLAEPEQGMVEIQSQVALGPEPTYPTGGLITLLSHEGVDVVHDDGPCMTATQTTTDGALVLQVTEPGSLRVESPNSLNFQIQLRQPDGATLPANRSMLTPGGASWLDLATTSHLVALSPGTHGLKLCGLASPTPPN